MPVEDTKVKFDTLSLLKIYALAILSSIAPVLILNYSGLSSVLGVAVGGVLYLFTYLTLMPIVKVVSSSELNQTSHAVQNIPILTKIAKLIISYQQKIYSFIA